jgi:MINDY deubiquitinase
MFVHSHLCVGLKINLPTILGANEDLYQGNILILRGNITIQPPERRTVSYELLSHLVAEHLLQCSPDVDVSDALSIMPVTQSEFHASPRFEHALTLDCWLEGMDLNPVFTSSTAFRPSGGGGGELKLFEHVGIKLVHGWLVDAGSQEAKALERAPDYDTAVGLIAEVDHLTNGKFVVDESTTTEEPVASGSSSSPMSPARTLTDKQHDMIADGELCPPPTNFANHIYFSKRSSCGSFLSTLNLSSHLVASSNLFPSLKRILSSPCSAIPTSPS